MGAPVASQPLPRGRHPLTREAVATSQRSRMVAAMAETVKEKGYAATTVADVVARAGVSRSTFYEQFGDIEACFLATFDDGVAFLFARIDAALAGAGDGDWRGRATTAIEAYLAALAETPEATWAFTIEALGAGAAARERRSAILRRWVGRWRALARMARRDDPSLPPPDDARLLALVGGIEELVRDRLLADGAEHLPELAGPATALALVTLDPTAR